ncbi:MAG: hypothetical protein ACQCXQ_11355 [Verrucomicrobiales bacterium]|nr:hypothetical protein [Verrucomicrobiota bacterium JB025]
MSLHAELSPAALMQLERQRRVSSLLSLAAAILTIVLIGLLLGLLLIPRVIDEAPTIVTYESSMEEDTDLEPEKVRTRTEVKPASPSAMMNRVIVSQSLSAVSIPVTDVEVDTPSIDFGTADFGAGWGSAHEFGGGGGAGGFGTTKKMMGTIAGYLYDFKKRSSGQPLRSYDAKVASHFTDPVQSLHRSKYSSSSLRRHFRAPQDLYLRYVAIPYASASDGPKFFKAEKEVEPTGWIAHYRGRVLAPKDGTFRFVGGADDYLSVMVNREFQLVATWPDILDEVTVRGANARKQPGRKGPFADTPLIHGEWFTVKKGQELDVAITLGERPGGKVGFMLMIEEKGADYRTARDGGPVLPPFALGTLADEDKQALRSFPGWEWELENVPVFTALPY